MKNITLKVDDATYRRARIRAAEAGTSVGAMVREFLNRDEGEGAVSEAKRIEAFEKWYAVIADRTSENSYPVRPFTRQEIYQIRLW